MYESINQLINIFLKEVKEKKRKIRKKNARKEKKRGKKKMKTKQTQKRIIMKKKNTVGQSTEDIERE